MSTNIMSFTPHRPFKGEGGAHSTGRSKAQGGREVRRAQLSSEGLFRVRQCSFRFPPNDAASFQTFFDARQGGYDTFLYLPKLEVWRVVTDEAVATANGVLTDFALDSKYLKASTLVVKVNAQTVSAYSLTGNNTAPLVEFSAAPTDTLAITATYDRYVPCRFDQDDFDFQVDHFGTDDDESTLRVTTLTWRQDYPGSHLV